MSADPTPPDAPVIHTISSFSPERYSSPSAVE